MKSLELSKPHMLVVVGLPGTGKTFFAKKFGDSFGAPYVDYEHFHQIAGSVELGDVVATELLGLLTVTKQTIVVEGRGETRGDRAVLNRVAKSKGYELLYVWVQTEPQTAKQRATKLKDEPYGESEYESRVASFDPLSPSIDPVVVISGKHTFPSQARMVLRKLLIPRTPPPTTTPPPRPPQQQKKPGRITVR